MSTRVKVSLAILVTALFWGSANVCQKILLRTLDPMSIMFFRLLVTSVILLPVFLKYNKVPLRSIVLDIVPVGLFATLNFAFYIIGLSKTTANAASIIYVMSPLFAALISRITIGEKTTKTKFLGVLLGLVGVLIILILPLIDHGQFDSGNITGNLLIFTAVCMWTFYVVGSRYLTTKKQYSPITITSTAMFFSCIVFFFLTIFTSTRNYIIPLSSSINILLIVYLALFVTAITFFLHQWVIQHTSAVTGTINLYLNAVSGFVFNAIFLSETFTPAFISGSVLVFIGTFIATSGKTTEYIRLFREKRQKK